MTEEQRIKFVMNHDVMSEWFVVPKGMPEEVLMEIIEPYIPIERDERSVVLYCDKYKTGIEKKLFRWKPTE